jgi:hypothetical protein
MTTPASEEDIVTRTSPETAVLAGGCFWEMQALLSALPGVISTRVGWIGGMALVLTNDLRPHQHPHSALPKVRPRGEPEQRERQREPHGEHGDLPWHTRPIAY